MSASNESNLVQLHAIVHGLVQGVNFRANTQREAARLNVTGWVKNRPDGTVETIAEGHRPALEQFERYLHRGPSMARVEQVEVSYGNATGKFSGFNIRY
jgi:acylphosphatase